MVPSMIVRVADENVEDQAREEFPQCLGGAVKRSSRPSRSAPKPWRAGSTVLCRLPVEAPDQQRILVIGRTSLTGATFSPTKPARRMAMNSALTTL